MKFVVSQYRKLRRVALLCFTNLLVSTIFMDISGGRERFSRFSLKNFCLTVPKNFVEKHFFVPKNFSFQKFLFKRVLSRFLNECFLSGSTEKRRRGIIQ